MDNRTSGTLPHTLNISQAAAPRRCGIAAASRRGVLAALSGGLMTRFPLAPAGTDAKGKGKRKKRKKNDKKGKTGRAETRADATCPGPFDDAFVISNGSRFAQTFTASTSGLLVRAELDIIKNEGSSGDYLLNLSPVDDAGVPTNDVLAVTFVANAAVPAGETTVKFDFADPAEVEAGTQYALVLTRLDGEVLTWLSRNGDVCVGRGFLSNAQPAPFEVVSDVDFIFTTFVRS